MSLIYRYFSPRQLTTMLALLAICVPVGMSTTAGSSTTHTFEIPTSHPSLPRDCSRDVTNALNYVFSLIPENSTLSFPANSCYRVNGTLKISGKRGLTVDGRNSRFVAMTDGRELPAREARTRDQFLVYKSTGITIKNAIAQGANIYAGLNDKAYVPELEAQHGFEVSSSTNVTLDHVQAYKVFGDFVYIGGATNPSRYVTVKNSTFRGNGRIGLTVANGTDVVVQNNVFDDMRRSIFDLEPYAGNWVIQRVTVQNNIIGEGRLNFLSAFGDCAVVEDIRILNNRLVNQELNAEVINNTEGCTKRRRNFTFSGNVSDKMFGTPSGMSLKFIGVDGIVLTNNVVPLQPDRGMHLARLTDSSQAWVTGNMLLGAEGSIFTNDGSNDYCHSGNKVGDPLTAEASLKPCT
jgi:hypothetical protein